MAKSLELNNRAIHNLQTDFSETQIDGSIKWVEQVRYNFPHCKGMTCQGLILFHKRKTGAKKLVLDYWLNTAAERILPNGRTVKGESRRFVLGYFNKDTFNVKHLEDKIAYLRKQYGNPNNLTWDLDISEGEQYKKRSRYTEQLSALQEYTINQVIESWYNSGCPKILRPSESLNKNTLRDNNRYLIGYHIRAKQMRYSADKNRNGVIKFTDASGVESMVELFKKYPSQQLENDNKITYGDNISLYDSILGQKNIRDLTEFDVRNYLNTLTKSPGTQRQIRECFSFIWAHALQASMLGTKPPQNPMVNIKIEKPTTSKFAKYDTEEFTKDEQSRIIQSCTKLRDMFLFQVQVVLLMLFCGRRKETFLALKWEHVMFDKEVHVLPDGTRRTTYGKIVIPTYVNKTSKPDKVLITENINNVLMDLHKQRKIMGWSMYSDWLFPSTRIPDKHLLTADNMANDDEHRMQDIRGLWARIKIEAKLRPALSVMKMFRNTYENTVNRNRHAASTWDVISVTGRADTGSSEKAYLNKSFTPEVVQLATSADESFDNIIKLTKVG